jgi:uncharacterized protein
VKQVDVVVLADTHLRTGIDRLDPRLLDALRGADLILHAGDFVVPGVLAELAECSEVFGVLGNNDTALRGVVPETLRFEAEGVTIAMVHDSGPRIGRAARMARRFPDAQLVVFGHSHIPVNELGMAGQVLFNPGSPTQRRSQPARTFGRLLLRRGEIRRRDIDQLG